MVDRNEFMTELQRLAKLSEDELRKEAQAKFDEQGSLVETLQFIQDYAEISLRDALMAYLVSDVIVESEDGSGD